MDSITLKVEGMTCSHCVKRVHKALTEVSGVESAEVSLEKGQAEVKGRDLNPEALTKAVEQAGYKAETE
jgi:copper chaperone